MFGHVVLFWMNEGTPRLAQDCEQYLANRNKPHWKRVQVYDFK